MAKLMELIFLVALLCVSASLSECRSLVSDENEARELSFDIISRAKRDIASDADSSQVAEDEMKKQHWSYGFAPGGKRDIGANEMENMMYPQKRQHWSYGFAPGGKRAFQNTEDSDETAKRQHWSYGFAPGGKRGWINANEMEELANELAKRQHWSYGFAPGGKRDLQLGEKSLYELTPHEERMVSEMDGLEKSILRRLMQLESMD